MVIRHLVGSPEVLANRANIDADACATGNLIFTLDSEQPPAGRMIGASRLADNSDQHFARGSRVDGALKAEARDRRIGAWTERPDGRIFCDLSIGA
jgi:hypothetical protein